MTPSATAAARRQLWGILAAGAGGFAAGALFGRAWFGVAVAFGLLLVLQWNRLRRLHRWLARPAQPIPELGGLWDEVVREVHRADRANARHKDLISGLFARLQAAAGAMPDAMVVLSQYDLIEWSNTQAARLLGLDVRRDVGMRLVHLVRHPALSAYLDSGDYHEPLILKDLAGGYVVEVQIIPFGASQKLVIGRDITHLIRLEQMRSHFVADVSHELRTPLTVLRGFLETLQDKGVTMDDVQGNLALMQEQAERMQRLIDDLLALARLETTPARRHDELVDVRAMSQGLRDLAVALSGERHHRIEVEAEPGLLIGNREELRSAFTNLVHNALRHTPAEGRIIIRWSLAGDGGRFSVQDYGEGIAAHHIPYLTERFYRVDSGRSRATGGTGLGLSIVRQVLARHDARLVIDSTIGSGSTFTCVFPLSRIQAAAATTTTAT
ncbi:MAG: phosphate regulon sensor histidine kinase PhoR [Gammaproteobacteria bacterium]|nr:phosphate regulon sensor histidine kinase PhoR [Gammaproteobacteria bacterium]